MRGSYRPGLDVDDLLGTIARLLRSQRGADGLICRYLADLADGLIRWPGLILEHGGVDQLARCKLGLTRRASRERIRVGKALRKLPALYSALMAGDLPYSRVREVTRVACPSNEQQWLKAARELSMRRLEQRVKAAGGRSAVRAPVRAAAPAGSAAPAGAPRSTATLPELVMFGSLQPSGKSNSRTVCLPERVWVLLERAMLGARERCAHPLTDVEAVEHVLIAALSQESGQSGAGVLAVGGSASSATQSGSGRSTTETAISGTAAEARSAAEGGMPSDDPLVAEGGMPSDDPLVAEGGVPSDDPWVAEGGLVTEPVTANEEGRAMESGDTTQSGSSDESREGVGRPGRRRAPLSSDARLLLTLIENGRDLNLATLGMQTGMPLPRLIEALSDLELSRRVQRDLLGFYEAKPGPGDGDSPFREASGCAAANPRSQHRSTNVGR